MFVYIMANKRNNVLYTGITSDLKKRIWEYKKKRIYTIKREKTTKGIEGFRGSLLP